MERRRMEGSSLKLEVMQKIPEAVQDRNGEMDLCWKKLTERIEEEVLDSYTRSKKAKERPPEVEVPRWWNGGRSAKKQ